VHRGPDEVRLTNLYVALADRYRIERELGAGGMATGIALAVTTAGGERMTQTETDDPGARGVRVHTALQKLPADRFENAKAFAAALSSEGAAASRHLTTAQQVGAAPARRTILLGLGAATAIAGRSSVASCCAGRIPRRPPPTRGSGASATRNSSRSSPMPSCVRARRASTIRPNGR